MKKLLFITAVLITLNLKLETLNCFAQVAINTTNNPADASAMLDVTSSSRGVLIPRMTQAERSAIANPATSLLVYQTDGASGYYYNSGSPSSPNWVALFTSATAGWSTTGNSGTDSTNFIGTTDAKDLIFKTNNSEKFRIAANGNVGIGTTGPIEKFAVYNSNDVTTNTVGIYNDNLHKTHSLTQSASGDGIYQILKDDATTKVSLNSNGDSYLNGGNVGIGTTSPESKLHIFGNSPDLILESSSMGSPSVKYKMSYSGDRAYLGWDYSTSNVVLMNLTSSSIIFGTAGNEKARIDASGNVGIGTVNPVNTIHLSKTNGVLGLSITRGSSEVATLGSGSSGTAEAGILQLYHGGSENIRFYANTGQNSWINNGGNVGIGTTGPGQALEVVGQIRSSFGSSAYYWETWSNIDPSVAGSNWGIKTHQYNLADTYPLTWTAKGNVGIGTTNPIFVLDVQNAKATQRIKSTTGTEEAYLSFENTGGTFYVGANNSVGNALTSPNASYAGVVATNAAYPLILGTNSLERVRISSAGNVGIGTTTPSHLLHLAGGAYCDGTGSWVSGSDRAYKRNIETMTKYGIQEILKLRPVTYIHKQDKNSKVQIGFIAQEVKELIPEIVEGEEGSMGIAYDRLVPVLVNAVKEQQEQINNQNEQIKVQQKKIEILEMKYRTSIESLQNIIENLKGKNTIEVQK
ncbi:MAG: tail fiber domain-containing protein [Bacteroidetes bacterium]|nr:tail fiber domain-containing protein [Bacteroidota bacterium]